MNITINDIAQKCNVSIATVSRVLNGSTRVSEKTRAKVLQVMKEMGYKPNPFARGLGLDSMKIVGVICTDVADIFYAHAVSLLEDGLRKHHFDVMLSNTGSDTGNTSLTWPINTLMPSSLLARLFHLKPTSASSATRPGRFPSSPSTATTINPTCTASSVTKKKA